MDKCRFHSESMYAYLQLINLSTTIHGPPPMYCMIFLGPPHFSCTKMMAHPHFFSSPPPPVLYDQSLNALQDLFDHQLKEAEEALTVNEENFADLKQMKTHLCSIYIQSLLEKIALLEKIENCTSRVLKSC